MAQLLERPSRPAIEAVLFDYGGVITEPPFEAMRAMAESAGAPLDSLVALLFDGYGDCAETQHPFHQVECGLMPLAELDRWGRAKGLERGWDLRLSELFGVASNLVVRDEMVGLLRSLRQRGYGTALVTNIMKECGAVWQARLPDDNLFDVIVASCDVGIRKPDPRIYEIALDGLGVTLPSRALMLDDLEENLAGASRLGMQTILVGSDTQQAVRQVEAALEGR